MAIETHNFSSRYASLQLVRQPGIPAYNALGKQQGWVQKPIVYQFVDQGGFGKLTLRDGQDPLPDGPFDPEKGAPTMQDALQWIRSIPEYNNVGVTGGFVEDGREPGRIPDPTSVLDDIGEAGVTLDADRLRAIIAEERDGYKREQVLTLAERTLSRVEKAIAAQEEGAPVKAPQNGGNAASKPKATAKA